MSKWIAEFDLEDGDTMPDHMDLEYNGAKIDFHCRPKEPILDKIRAEILSMMPSTGNWMYEEGHIVEQTACEVIADVLQIIDKYKSEKGEIT